MDNRPIGFLDSGVGGLTVVRELMRQLPHEEIVYIGDSARAPYGPRPAEQIREYTWQLVNFLLTKDVKMIVIACNTATAVVWEEIKAQLDIPVLGVILPGASAAIKSSQGGKIGVIGTPMTVQSDIYRQKIHDLDPDLQVESLACPKFAPLVESGALSTSVTKKVVYETLRPLVGKVDSLILGCTHYPLLRPIIQNVMGPRFSSSIVGQSAYGISQSYLIILKSIVVAMPDHSITVFTQQPAAKVLHKLVKNGWKKRFMWSM